MLGADELCYMRWNYCVVSGRRFDNAGRMIASRSVDPSDPAVVQRIYEIRGEVRRRDARPNDGRCGNVAAALEAEFGWPSQHGYLKLLDATVSWIHCWNRLPNGTIVDATADQFQSLWL